MEREMCQYLEWKLNIDPVTLHEFEEMVKKDFVGKLVRVESVGEVWICDSIHILPTLNYLDFTFLPSFFVTDGLL